MSDMRTARTADKVTLPPILPTHGKKRRYIRLREPGRKKNFRPSQKRGKRSTRNRAKEKTVDHSTPDGGRPRPCSAQKKRKRENLSREQGKKRGKKPILPTLPRPRREKNRYLMSEGNKFLQKRKNSPKRRKGRRHKKAASQKKEAHTLCPSRRRKKEGRKDSLAD